MTYLAIALGYILTGIALTSIIVYSTRRKPNAATAEDLPLLLSLGLGWPIVIISALISLPAYHIGARWFQFLSTRP